MEIQIPGLDVKSGLELCDGDTKFFVRALRLFIAKIPDTLDKMRNVTEGTLHDYSIVVHGLKSNSVYIGAEEIRKTAKELETLSKEGDLSGVQARNDAFIQYIENLLNDIRSWLEKHDAAKL